MLTTEEYLIEYLISSYHVPKDLAKRYAEVIKNRAIRFYLRGNLDSMVVSEDLYNGDDFDCSCPQEAADKDQHLATCEYIVSPYPNLTYAEEEQEKWLKEEGKYL